MSKEIEVKIVDLEPVRVLSFHGFGPSPEPLAYTKMYEWAKPKGLLDNKEQIRIFGFNNPSPSPGSPNYGYDVWLTVGPEVKGDDEVEVIEFPGGLYGVTPVKGIPNIGKRWKELVAWRESSHYKRSHHQWLEENIRYFDDLPEDEVELMLYIPIRE